MQKVSGTVRRVSVIICLTAITNSAVCNLIHVLIESYVGVRSVLRERAGKSTHRERGKLKKLAFSKRKKKGGAGWLDFIFPLI